MDSTQQKAAELAADIVKADLAAAGRTGGIETQAELSAKAFDSLYDAIYAKLTEKVQPLQ